MATDDTRGFEGLDIWQLVNTLQHPLAGNVASLPLGRDIDADTMPTVAARREAARVELVRRGFDDAQIEVLQRGGREANQIITDYLAAGGPRHG